MKNNYLKIIISIAILIIALSIAYYFIFFLPKNKDANQLLQKQIECQKNGIILYEQNKEIENVMPLFEFSKKLNTCLYIGGRLSMESSSAIAHGFIKDVYSNEEIVSYTTITKDNKSHDLLVGGLVSREEFERRIKELFGE